jgi:spermidine/putrescine transport system permease protein
VRRLCRTVVALLGAACVVAAVPAWVGVARGLLRGQVGVFGVIVAVVATGLGVVAVRRLPSERLLMGYSVFVYAALYLPIVVVIVYAFSGSRVVGVWEGFSTRWVVVALSDPTITASVGRSLRIALAAAIFSTALGTVAALAITRARASVRFLFDTVVFLTLVVPELVLGTSLLLFFVRLNFQLTTTTIMLGHIVFGTSVATLIIRARFAGMSSELEQASVDLGAGPLATFRQITLPRLAPAILAAAALVFILSFDDVLTSLFTSGAGNDTWPLVILASIRFGLRPSINATIVMMLGITLMVMVVTAIVLRGFSRRSSLPRGRSEP